MTRRALAAAWCVFLAIGLPDPPARAITASSVNLCAFVKPTGTQTADDAVNRFETQIGRTLDVHREYEKWGSSFPGPLQQTDARKGRIPFIDWSVAPSQWGPIAKGQRDRWIKARARDVKSFGRTIYLGIKDEPENDGGRPGDFVAAWRHLHHVFRHLGVRNVRWVWTLMAWTFEAHDATPWYPGARYVDYVGVDGYSWYPGRRGSRWRSFEEIFKPAHDWSRSHNKPMIISETGVQEDPGNALRKTAWFVDALATLQSWPNVKTFCYFDSNQIYKWWVDSSTASLTGFRSIANDQYMGG